MRRYVFSEFTPFSELTSSKTLELLREEELTVYVAFTPKLVGDAVEVVSRVREAGVEIGVWPLLSDHDGRWANEWNGVAFAETCRRLLDRLDEAGVLPSELLIDLEPPISATKRMLRARPKRIAKPRLGGAAALSSLVHDVSGELCPVSAAAAPWAAVGDGRVGWQHILGTPIDGLPFERVFLMAYSSLIEGYSRGALKRRHAESMLWHWTAKAAETFAERAAIAIGVVGVGALGDEQTYSQTGELESDLALCRGAGAQHVALFNLAGVLHSSDPKGWLHAFAANRLSIEPAPTKRVQALMFALRSVGLIGSRFRP